MGCIDLVRCVLVLRCGMAVVVWYPYAGWVSRKLLRMDVLTFETCWALKKERNKASDIKLVSLYSTIPRMSKKDHYRSKFGFALPCFLLPRWTGAPSVHGLALTFRVVLKINHDSSQVITFSKIFGSFSMFWRMSAQLFIQISFCSVMRSLGTIFEHTIFMLNLLCKICRTVSLSMLINSATARMFRRRFCWTISLNFSLLASVFDVLGWLGCWWSSISPLPSLNLLNHLKTWVWDRHSSP